MTRLLVVDDHAVVREGLKRIIEETGDLRVAGEAGSAREALDRVREGEWDAVLLDISLPDRNGLELLKEIRQLRPGLPALVLSVHPEDPYAARVVKAGGSGYLNKESAPEQLILAIRRIIAGGTYLSEPMRKRLSESGSPDGDAGVHERLSDREFEVLRLMGSGLSPKDISIRLKLNPKTVNTYRTRIMKKLGLRTSNEVITFAIRAGLVSPGPVTVPL